MIVQNPQYKSGGFPRDIALLLSAVALLLLGAGCFSPNMKEYVTQSATATSVRRGDQWPYEFFQVGNSRKPIDTNCLLELLVRDRRFRFSELRSSDVASWGGTPDRLNTFLPKGAVGWSCFDAKFVFMKDRLIYADLTWLSSKRAPYSLGKAGNEQTHQLPMTESDLQSLIGPADKINWFKNW